MPSDSVMFLIPDLAIFLSEVAEFFLGITIWLFFTLIIIVLVEYLSQFSKISIFRIFMFNSIFVVTALILFMISDFIIIWRAGWLGGEVLAAILVLLIDLLLLCAFKVKIVAWSRLRFSSPKTVILFVLVLTILPVIACHTYVLLLGSQWTI